MSAILSFLISFLFFGSSFAAIPEAVCRMSDPALDACLKDSFNKLIPKLSEDGIPEVGLDPLDPFVIKGFKVESEGKRFNGVLSVVDLEVTGLTKTAIRAIRSDLNKPTNQALEIKITNPKLMVTGKYTGSATIEGMKVFGDGEFKIVLKNIGATVRIVGDSRKGRNGKKYFTIRDLDLTPVIGYLNVDATGLFGKNTVLSSFVLEQINNFWRPFYDSLFPEVKPMLEKVIKDTINLYTTKVPTDKIILS